MQFSVGTRSDLDLVKAVAATCLVFLAALVSRLSMLELPAIYDELYQLLPALSWQQQKDFSVLDGVYDRAWRFTQLIAFSLDLAREPSLAAARFLPSVVPGALLVAIVFLWAWFAVGRMGALVAAVFLIFWPNGIEVSQYLRFYALQGVVFIAGALLVYVACTRETGWGGRLLLLLPAVPLFVFAIHLQQTSLLGIGTLLLWVALVPGWGWLRDNPDRPRLLAILAGCAVFLGVLAVIVVGDTLRGLWQIYRWEPWPAVNDLTFYHRYFRDNYPTFWPLFPVAALIALRVNFVPASFCVLIFATTFFIQSFGGLKGVRYLYPTMPFFFVTWAIVVQAGLKPVLDFLSGMIRDVLPLRFPAPLRTLTVLGLLAACGLWLLAANAALVRSAGLMAGAEREYLLGKRRWAWHEAAEITRPWLEAGAVIVTREEMLAIAWLGDYDLGYNKPRFSELLFTIGPDTPPFTVDARSGRPLVGEREDIARVISCHPVGVVMANAGWTHGEEAQALRQQAEAAGAEIETRVGSEMSILGWRRAGPVPEGVDCSGLEAISGAAGRILSGERQPRLPASARLDK